jgi:hypothetical protein
MLLKLERTEGRWLSESLDVKSNELMDFLFDGMGWGCHHNLLIDFKRGLILDRFVRGRW